MHLKLDGISFSFTEAPVLDNISTELTFKSLAIIGPSGGGKSTLLRLLAGLLKPDSGTVTIDDQLISFTDQELRKHRTRLGFVFQSKGLFGHLTALANICLPLVHVHQLDPREAESRAIALLERFNLADQAEKHPHEMSGGQQQRVAIARAVAQQPEWLLLDEPTSALDPEYTSDVLDMLGELQHEGLQTLLVTHEMGFARHACDATAFLAEGRIVEAGDTASLFNEPESKELSAFLDKILHWN